MIIAIDGPSGVGKSTVSKAIAKRLGFHCLDTGAMYRCVAYRALAEHIDLHDEAALTALAERVVITFGHVEGDPVARYVYLDGQDVTARIRTGEIDRAVSPVAAVPGVRAALVTLQQKIGAQGNYVVEGRDIGTVVFPHAAVKVFLTASAEERAHRRVRQNIDLCVGSCEYESILADLRRRDEIDSTRKTSPLVPAEDAVIIDTTTLYIEEVIEKICTLAQDAAVVEAAMAHDEPHCSSVRD